MRKSSAIIGAALTLGTIVAVVKIATKKPTLIERLYEYCNSGDNLTAPISGENYHAQTFTPSVGHTLTKVRLKCKRVGSLGSIELAITDTYGEIPGVDLSYLEFDGNSLPDTDSWIEFTVPEVALSADIMYAIVMHVPDGDSSNRIDWRYAYPSDYPRGTYCWTSPGGISWNIGTMMDLMFEEWGLPL